MSVYSSTILADNPIRYYRLGEAVNDRVVDSSGNTHYGTGIVSGLTSNVAGAMSGNTAMSFNGTSGFIALPTTGLPSGNSAWTLECWFKVLTVPTAAITLIDLGTHNTGQDALLGTDGSGHLTVGTWSEDVATSTSPSATVWHHFAGTWNPGTGVLTAYYDGAVLGTRTGLAARNLVLASTPAIGRLNTGSAYFNGSCDEVAIYTTCLSSSRISAHYAAASTSFSSYSAAVLADTPATYYHLDDTLSLPPIVDSSTSAQNGALNGDVIAASSLLANDSNGALRFDGNVNTYVSAPGTGLPSGNAAWSVECWFNASAYSPDSGHSTFMAAFGGSSTSQGAGLWIDSAGKVAASVVNHDVITSSAVALNTTYHAVATWDGTTLRGYLNGATFGSLALSALGIPSGNPVFIAHGPSGYSGGFDFAGVVDETAYYNYVLTPSQVLNHYQAGSNSQGSGTLQEGTTATLSATIKTVVAGAATLGEGTQADLTGAIYTATTGAANVSESTLASMVGNVFAGTGVIDLAGLQRLLDIIQRPTSARPATVGMQLNGKLLPTPVILALPVPFGGFLARGAMVRAYFDHADLITALLVNKLNTASCVLRLQGPDGRWTRPTIVVLQTQQTTVGALPSLTLDQIYALAPSDAVALVGAGWATYTRDVRLTCTLQSDFATVTPKFPAQVF